MRSQSGMSACLALLGSIFVSGCGSESFVPPPPPELRPRTLPLYSAPVTAKEVVLVLPAEENIDLLNWEGVIRQGFGTSDMKLAFRTLRPEATDPPSKQAELINQAAVGASAIIVVTNNSPETTKALAAIDTSKTPIVLLGRPLPKSPEADKIKSTLITYPAFDDSAKQLVQAGIDDARKRLDLAKGPIECALIRCTIRDESSAARSQALIDAAKAAKLTLVEDKTFDGGGEMFKQILQEIVIKHPKIGLILCEEETALSGLTMARQPILEGPTRPEAPPKPLEPRRTDEFKIVGYFASKTNANLARLGQVSALCDRNATGIARETVRVVQELIQGKTVANRIEVPLTLIRAQSDTTERPRL